MYVMGVDGRGMMSLGRGTRPRWSPDSAWLVFAVTRDDGYQITSSDLYIVSANGGERIALTATEEELEMNPDWSPRGDRIVFDSVYSGNLYVLELEQK